MLIKPTDVPSRVTEVVIRGKGEVTLPWPRDVQTALSDAIFVLEGRLVRGIKAWKEYSISRDSTPSLLYFTKRKL